MTVRTTKLALGDDEVDPKDEPNYPVPHSAVSKRSTLAEDNNPSKELILLRLEP